MAVGSPIYTCSQVCRFPSPAEEGQHRRRNNDPESPRPDESITIDTQPVSDPVEAGRIKEVGQIAGGIRSGLADEGQTGERNCEESG